MDEKIGGLFRNGGKQIEIDNAEASVTPPDIGKIIAAMRKERKLSLEGLAAISGVSKSMLSKIERSQTNPTLGTVWRLATGFQLGIEQLIGQADNSAPIRHQRAYAVPTLKSADGGCTIRILSAMGLPGGLEWYDISADPYSTLESAAHDPGAVEHLMVIEGMFTVESGGNSIDVSINESASYPADVKHALRNAHSKRARALVVVTYRNGVDRSPAR